MSIEDDSQSIIRLGTVHGWIFRVCLWGAPIFGLWAINTIVRHDTDIAVLKMQISMMSAGKEDVSQNVNVGQADTAEAELVNSARNYVTTADVAAREHVTERAVLDWISAGRIHPQPVKVGKAWTIARNFRILPQDPESCGDSPN